MTMAGLYLGLWTASSGGLSAVRAARTTALAARKTSLPPTAAAWFSSSINSVSVNAGFSDLRRRKPSEIRESGRIVGGGGGGGGGDGCCRRGGKGGIYGGGGGGRQYETTTRSFARGLATDAAASVITTAAAHDAGHAPPTPELLAETATRRSALCAALPPNSLAIVRASCTPIMANDIPYRFRQNTDFNYLTAFPEPDAVLLLRNHATGIAAADGGGSGGNGDDAAASSMSHHHHSLLCVLPKNAHRELWDGPRVGVEAAPHLYGMDEAHCLDVLSAHLRAALRDGVEHVFYCDSAPAHTQTDELVQRVVGEESDTGSGPGNCLPLQPYIHKLRLYKSDYELDIMHAAARISSRAFADAMELSYPGIGEGTIDSLIEHTCRIHGASFLAYPPVVAGGARANILHYVLNDKPVGANELVLVDAGCELQGYASDISRSFPVGNSGFTGPQRELYSALLRVQETCLQACSVVGGTNSLAKLHQLSRRLLLEESLSLGLVPQAASSSARGALLSRLYPHSVGHYLGMDVHDTDTIPGSTPFATGMVITVEPGLYVPDDEAFPKRYRNIGLRIEDNVAFVEEEEGEGEGCAGGGCSASVLTSDCPKSIDDIEKLCGSGEIMGIGH